MAIKKGYFSGSNEPYIMHSPLVERGLFPKVLNEKDKDLHPSNPSETSVVIPNSCSDEVIKEVTDYYETLGYDLQEFKPSEWMKDKDCKSYKPILIETK